MRPFRFTILTTRGAVSGQFEDVDCPDIYQIEYLSNAVVVHVIAEPTLGDSSCDGCVDGLDLDILLASYRLDDGGDLTGDGVADHADLALLLSLWGEGC